RCAGCSVKGPKRTTSSARAMPASATESTGVRHERVATSSTWIVLAPQSPRPHPNFVAVIPLIRCDISASSALEAGKIVVAVGRGANHGNMELATDDRAGVEIVGPRRIAEAVDIDAPAGIARECKAASGVEESGKPKFISGAAAACHGSVDVNVVDGR